MIVESDDSFGEFPNDMSPKKIIDTVHNCSQRKHIKHFIQMSRGLILHGADLGSFLRNLQCFWIKL